MSAATVLQPSVRVVIADDAAMIRVLLRHILEASTAFRVVGEAADGEEAVRLAASQRPDLIVLDLAMPAVDGLEAISRIRQASPATRIAVLSGFNAERMARRALEEGADAYLEKRDTPETLVSRLLEVCHSPATSADTADAADSLEHAARESRERFRLAFEHAPIGIALESLEGHFLKVNDALCRITGYSPDELLGRTGDTIGHPDDLAADRAQRENLLAGRAATASADHRFLRPDGRPVWTRVSRSLMRDQSGQPLEFVTQVVDISAQKRAEARQRYEEAAAERYAEELARSNAELAHFASVAAHELRSPLQVISGFGSLLARLYAPVLDDRGRESVDWIIKSAARLDALIDDLLAYTRVGATERPGTTVDLGAVMDEVARTLEARPGRVTWDDLPAVTGDPIQLHQLLLNLVTNGCKFVAGGNVPHVHVSAERQPDGWCVTVADNGIGIDAADRPEIFEMFKRLHKREEYDGTGIGLAICKRIVEGGGGAIWVEDRPGGGSRFRFTIPDRARPSAPAVPVLPAGEAAAPLGVEDELRLRIGRALRYATLTGERVSVFSVDLKGTAGTDELTATLMARLQQAIRPHDTVDRTGETQFTVVCTGMSSPQDVATVRARLGLAAAELGLSASIGEASSVGEEAPADLLGRARGYGSNR